MPNNLTPQELETARNYFRTLSTVYGLLLISVGVSIVGLEHSEFYAWSVLAVVVLAAMHSSPQYKELVTDIRSNPDKGFPSYFMLFLEGWVFLLGCTFLMLIGINVMPK